MPDTPKLLEVVNLDGAILHFYDDASISIEVEAGLTIDVTVQQGEQVSNVLEIPLQDLRCSDQPKQSKGKRNTNGTSADSF